MTSTTVARNVVTGLRDMGVRHVFGVPSGGWVDYMEAIRTTDGIDFVLTSHEGGAGFMADVCGRLTGVPGVCFGTFGSRRDRTSRPGRRRDARPLAD